MGNVDNVIEQLVKQLLALPDEPARRAFLETHAHSLSEGDASELADALKAQADHYLRAELAPCWQFTRLLFYLAELRHDEFTRALALRAEGNALSIGQAHFREAIEKYDEAAVTYRVAGRELDEAKSQIGKVFALTNLGRYDEAIAVGERVADVFRLHGGPSLLATNLMNLGIAYRRQGNAVRALEQYNQALLQYGNEQISEQASIYINRAEALCDLGRFNEAIADAKKSLAHFRDTQQPAIEAFTLRAMGEISLSFGRYNEALQYLEQARDIFEADHRDEDVAITNWLMCDPLILTGRYVHVIALCRRAIDTFLAREERFEAAQTLMRQAHAFSGTKQFSESISTLVRARNLFASEGNQVWAAVVNLNLAEILTKTHRNEEALELATTCCQLFEEHKLLTLLAQAEIACAQTLAQMGRVQVAEQKAQRACHIAKQQHALWVAYKAEMVLAQVARKRGSLVDTQKWLDDAIAQYEQLRSSWMIEHRADFAQDKQDVYAFAAEIRLAQNDATLALDYVERAKSRALIDILAHRADLSIRPRTPADEPLIQTLNQLRARRNQLIRRMEANNRKAPLHLNQQLADQSEDNQHLHQLEQSITDQWHSLLVRNAEYARDASLWQVQVEPVQEQLQPGQTLIEYAELNGNWVAFVATPQAVTAHTLPITPAQTQTLLRNLWLNFKTVASSPQTGSHAPALLANAKEVLRRLHAGLVEPLHPALAAAQHVFVVPYGSLHYLPFQALFDGERGAFWVESTPYTLSYLPCASILKYCRHGPKSLSDGRKLPFGERVGEEPLPSIAFGHSWHGHLPHAPHETQHIAQTLGGMAFTEAEATLSRFQELASTANVIHLAMHGDFRADAPLFSGLHFEDGMLTTLDTYNLRLNASLVALSACQTGRGVLGGGDELLGLMRGFLGAGAASLLLSLWRVEDHSTLALMAHFYGALVQGQTKAAALRQAQLKVMQQWLHPYFWAPFMLAGDEGAIPDIAPVPETA